MSSFKSLYNINKNEEYSIPVGASIYNFKNNYNNFLSNLSKINFKNQIKNSKLKLKHFFSQEPIFWQFYDTEITGFDSDYTWTKIKFYPNGVLSQKLYYLEPNTIYTLIFYGFAENFSETLSIGVSASGNDPLIYASNLSNSAYTEIYSYIHKKSDIISIGKNDETKIILKFKTRSYTDGTGNDLNLTDKYILQITNKSSTIEENLYFHKICLFEGNMELNEVNSSNFDDFAKFNNDTNRWELYNGFGYEAIITENNTIKNLISVIKPKDFTYHTTGLNPPTITNNNFTQFLLQTLDIKNNTANPQIYFEISSIENKFFNPGDTSTISIIIDFILNRNVIGNTNNTYIFECALMSIDSVGSSDISTNEIATELSDTIHSKYIRESGIFISENENKLFKKTLTLYPESRLHPSNLWVGYINILLPNREESNLFETIKIVNVTIYSESIV